MESCFPMEGRRITLLPNKIYISRQILEEFFLVQCIHIALFSKTFTDTLLLYKVRNKSTHINKSDVIVHYIFCCLGLLIQNRVEIGPKYTFLPYWAIMCDSQASCSMQQAYHDKRLSST